jgi:hypothetical protein
VIKLDQLGQSLLGKLLGSLGTSLERIHVDCPPLLVACIKASLMPH